MTLLSQGASIRDGDSPAHESACPAEAPQRSTSQLDKGLGGQGTADTENECLLHWWDSPSPEFFALTCFTIVQCCFFYLEKTSHIPFKDAGGDNVCVCGRIVLDQHSSPREIQKRPHPWSPRAHSFTWLTAQVTLQPYTLITLDPTQQVKRQSLVGRKWFNKPQASSPPQARQGAAEVLMFQS